jgi:succinate dehydrogenase assembly factor 1
MNFLEFARNEFGKGRDIDRKDFATIEFMIRKGHRQLEIYDDPGITNISR